jgi:hypothetical protein
MSPHNLELRTFGGCETIYELSIHVVRGQNTLGHTDKIDARLTTAGEAR